MDINLYAKYVNISQHREKIVANLEGVCISEIIDEVGMDKILDEIGIESVLEYFGIETYNKR